MPKKSVGAILKDLLEDVQNMLRNLQENVENDTSSLRMIEERLKAVDDESRMIEERLKPVDDESHKGRELVKEFKNVKGYFSEWKRLIQSFKEQIAKHIEDDKGREDPNTSRLTTRLKKKIEDLKEELATKKQEVEVLRQAVEEFFV